MIKHFNRKNINIASVLVFIIFSLYALSMLYALFWAAISSLKEPLDYIMNKNGLPEKWVFSNYITAFRLLSANETSLIQMFFNSIWLTVGSSLISVMVSAMTAYVVAKYEFIGRRVVYAVAVGVMLLPIFGALPAQYTLYKNLNIYDSPLILITSASGTGFIFLMLHSFMKALPWAYAESAEIDGANPYRIFFTIMLPVAMPALLSMMLVCLINGWNDYMTPIYFLPSHPTLASGLYTYGIVSEFNLNYPVYFAGILLSCVPTLLLFIFFQDKVMESVAVGGIKG